MSNPTKLKYGSEEANLLETVRRIVKKEIDNMLKNLRGGNVSSYSTIMRR